MSHYILGIDVGTTSIKAVLLERGSKALVASQTLPTAADVAGNSGIKVSILTRQKLNNQLNEIDSPLSNDTAGKRTATRSHHRCSEQMHLSTTQRQT